MNTKRKQSLSVNNRARLKRLIYRSLETARKNVNEYVDDETPPRNLYDAVRHTAVNDAFDNLARVLGRLVR